MHDWPWSSCLDVNLPSPITRIHEPLLEHKGLRLFIKRDDLIHEHLQGNKWRKLKYNLIEAHRSGRHRLLTFGGAWSNHIHATAAAGHYLGFDTIGVIRGEPAEPLNPTLRDARDWGMHLHYVDRASYRRKTEAEFIAQLHRRFGDFYLIPEGGNNDAGMRGCAEIIDELDRNYDTLCVDCGTGATLAGLVAALNGRSHVLGFAVLKNAGFLVDDIRSGLARQNRQDCNNWSLNLDYHFGGYARTSKPLFEFIDAFKRRHDIQLEPVYSGKMLYGIYELIQRDYFARDSDILVIHSGGLQGLRGFDDYLSR